MKSFYKASFVVLTLTTAVGVGTYYSNEIQALLKDGKESVESIYRSSPVPRAQKPSLPKLQQQPAHGSSQSSPNYLAEPQVLGTQAQLPARAEEAPLTPEQRLKKIEGLLENLVHEVGAVGEQTTNDAYNSVYKGLESSLQKAELTLCQRPLSSMSYDVDSIMDKYLTPEAQGQRYLQGLLNNLSQLDNASYSKLAAAVSAGKPRATKGSE